MEIVRSNMRVIAERFSSNSHLFSRSTILPGIIDLRTIATVERIPMIVGGGEGKESTWRREGVNIGLKICTLAIPIWSGTSQAGGVTNDGIEKSLSLRVIRVDKCSLNSLHVQLLLTVLHLGSKVRRLLTDLLSHKSIKNDITEVQVTCKPTIMKLHQMLNIYRVVDSLYVGVNEFSLSVGK